MAASNPDDSSQDGEGKEDSHRIYCANCYHCKVVTTDAGDGKHYLRVRCSAGRWKKKLGEEKVYKYFTVIRRSVEACEDYSPMGDAAEFIRELKRTLPIKDEAYALPLESGIS